MPPRMFRDYIDPKEIEDLGEREVYVALKKSLPDDWVVFYHYVYCCRGFFPFDGEADFIILAPERGILFLEVKQSRSCESIDGVWYAIGKNKNRTEVKNPFEQAIKNKHSIIKIICNKLGLNKNAFPATYGHVVIYPFGVVQGTLPASQTPQVFIDCNSMNDLYTRLERAFFDFGYKRNSRFLEKSVFDKVFNILLGNTKFVPLTCPSIDHDVVEPLVIQENQVLEDLTRDQYEVFRNMLARNRVKINGKAGSGKTMIAVWTAEALASIGDEVLLLCYNRLLAEWINLTYELPENVKVTTFHGLFFEYANNANIINNYNTADPKFWLEDCAIGLLEAISKLGDKCKFNSIIVDEGQDFAPYWWLPIEDLLKSSHAGHFYIFYDPEQSIYLDQQLGVKPEEIEYPVNMDDYYLWQNCRNTVKITKYCENFTDNPIATFEKSPEGTIPNLLSSCDNASNRAKIASKIIKDWLNEGFNPAEIAVISPWKKENPSSTLNNLDEVANYKITGEREDLPKWIGGDLIWGSTIKAFKGLEATCVMITDIPKLGTVGFNKHDMYVAASRAKLRLVLLPASNESFEEVQKWIRTLSIPNSVNLG